MREKIRPGRPAEVVPPTIVENVEILSTKIAE